MLQTAAAAVLLAGCAHLHDPGASLDAFAGDPVQCEIIHARLCIAQVWLYLKARFD